MPGVKVDDNTDIQSAYDAHADPTLRQAEAKGSDAGYVSSGLDQLEQYANDPANHIADAENNTAGNAGYIDNTSKIPHVADSGKNAKLLNVVKKAGPTSGIVGGLIAAVIAIGTASPGLLLQHLTAGLVNAFDTRSTTSTIRTNKLLVKKLVGDTTSGSCNYVKLICRYNKPSNKLLRNLEKQGVIAYDSNNKVIKSGGLWPNGRPEKFKFTRSNGVTSEITAAQFSRALQDDVEFRKAFHTAYNSRFQNFSDSIFRRVMSIFGTSKADKLGSSTDEDDVKKKLNTASEGDDIGAKAAKEGGEEAAEEIIEKVAKEEVEEMTKKLAKTGKSDATLLAAGVMCAVGDAPGIASRVARAYQMAQLVKYAMLFLTVADKMRAGDAQPTEVSALGSILTMTYKDSSGNVTSKAAVDSFGVKYALFGDTNTSQKTAGIDYKKFAPGGSVVSSLSGIVKVTDSKVKKDFCNAASNPLTGIAIKAAMAGTVVGTIPALLTTAIGWAAGTLIEAKAGDIASWAVGLIKQTGAIQVILEALLGDITQDIYGEDSGNALTSGAANMMATSASIGGNLPLSIPDAMAFDKVKTEVNLAYAAEDRVGRSIFDISSPNTFLGSIVSRFIPYSSQVASISGAFSMVASISLGSFATIFSPATKAYSGEEYTLCDDKGINDGTTAVGPFCNIIYGIPTQHLGADPGAVLEYMISTGQVDEDSGEPKPDSELENWIGMCLDGKTDQALNCQLDGPGTNDESAKKYSYFALYTVDHQIQRTMDGEDDVESAARLNPGYTGNPGNTPVPAIEGLPAGGVKDTAEGRAQAWGIAQQFINDLNAIRKGKTGYPFKNITNSALGYNLSAGTPGKSASGGPCFAGASNCDQCYALTAWFLDKYTTKTIGSTTGSGDGVVAYLKSKGVPTGNTAQVYSVFSYGRAVGGSGAHTGIVVGVDGDNAITVENNYMYGGTLYINKRPISGAKFRGTGDPTTFAYLGGIISNSPKKY